MLEPPWLGISNTHNLCFVSKIRKIGIPPANSSFSIYRSGVYGGIPGAYNLLTEQVAFSIVL